MIKDTFLSAEKLFTDELFRKTQNQTNLNTCCDANDENIMIEMATHIREVPQFSTLSLKDIFIVLIFTYYSLRYNEQTEEWLTTGFLNRILYNKELGKQLYFQITTGDIMVNDDNLSSAIRRYIMEMNGGKKKSRKSTKSRKSRKSRKYK